MHSRTSEALAVTVDGCCLHTACCLFHAVTFKQCLAAVARWAFVTSPYPVILTLECHAGKEQQATMAANLQQVGARSPNYLPARSTSRSSQ